MKEKLKNNVYLENKGETLIFMSGHFDETMTIWISHFSILVHSKF